MPVPGLGAEERAEGSRWRVVQGRERSSKAHSRVPCGKAALCPGARAGIYDLRQPEVASTFKKSQALPCAVVFAEAGAPKAATDSASGVQSSHGTKTRNSRSNKQIRPNILVAAGSVFPLRRTGVLKHRRFAYRQNAHNHPARFSLLEALQ